MKDFVGQKMETQFNVLGQRIDLYFHDLKFEIEFEEKDHKYCDIEYDIAKHKVIEEKLDGEFIRFRVSRI